MSRFSLIALAIYMVLVGIATLTNIEVVGMRVAIGISALACGLLVTADLFRGAPK